jgi:hypothetical protein
MSSGEQPRAPTLSADTGSRRPDAENAPRRCAPPSRPSSRAQGSKSGAQRVFMLASQPSSLAQRPSSRPQRPSSFAQRLSLLAQRGSEHALNGAESAMRGAERAMRGAESAMNGAESAMNGAESAISRAEHALNGAESAISRAESAISGAERRSNSAISRFLRGFRGKQVEWAIGRPVRTAVGNAHPTGASGLSAVRVGTSSRPFASSSFHFANARCADGTRAHAHVQRSIRHPSGRGARVETPVQLIWRSSPSPA